MCNTIPEDENGVQVDINPPLSVEEKLRARITELEIGLRFIAKDMAALETDCVFSQCDAYVMKAKELLGYYR